MLAGVRYDSEVDLKVSADGSLTADEDEVVGKVQFVPRTIEFLMLDRVRSVPDLRVRLDGLGL